MGRTKGSVDELAWPPKMPVEEGTSSSGAASIVLFGLLSLGRWPWFSPFMSRVLPTKACGALPLLWACSCLLIMAWLICWFWGLKPLTLPVGGADAAGMLNPPVPPDPPPNARPSRLAPSDPTAPAAAPNITPGGPPSAPATAPNPAAEAARASPCTAALPAA